MSKPRVNFIWVGQPQLNLHGGQDVIGIESIDENFKKHPAQHHPPNPIIFWCLGKYKKQYEQYFHQKGIEVQVKSIEDFLQEQIKKGDAQAQPVFALLNKLMSRDRPMDRVNAKDLMTRYLAARLSGYYLDTNITVDNQGESVKFEEHKKYRFPVINRTGPDVWMQYIPEALSRAQRSLDTYLAHYQIFETHCQKKSIQLYCPEYHDLLGELTIISTTLREDILNDDPDTYQTEEVEVWDIHECRGISEYAILDMNLLKEYYSSHYDLKNCLAIPHRHVFVGDWVKLKRDLEHGVDVNLTCNPMDAHEKATSLGYDAKNETLLLTAMHYCAESRYLSCAQLLLEQGANVNAIQECQYYIPDASEPGNLSKRHPTGFAQYSPLTHALTKQSQEAVQLLFDHATMPVNLHQVLNNETALMLAVQADKSWSLEWLLEKGANPNQQWLGQQANPLYLALQQKNEEAVRLLLSHGANPLVEDVFGPVETSEACRSLLEEAKNKLQTKLYSSSSSAPLFTNKAPHPRSSSSPQSTDASLNNIDPPSANTTPQPK